MSALTFRNLDVSPDAPVSEWPNEGIVMAIERGYLSDWRRIAAEISRSPWGRVAQAVADYAGYGEERAVASLLLEHTRRVREQVQAADQQAVATRVKAAITRSGLTARDFARECGTSPTRLSTYRSGRVQPSAAMLVRIERVADRLAAAR